MIRRRNVINVVIWLYGTLMREELTITITIRISDLPQRIVNIRPGQIYIYIYILTRSVSDPTFPTFSPILKKVIVVLGEVLFEIIISGMFKWDSNSTTRWKLYVIFFRKIISRLFITKPKHPYYKWNIDGHLIFMPSAVIFVRWLKFIMYSEFMVLKKY